MRSLMQGIASCAISYEATPCALLQKEASKLGSGLSYHVACLASCARIKPRKPQRWKVISENLLVTGVTASNGIPLGAKLGTNYGLAPIVPRDFCSLCYLTLEEKLVVGDASSSVGGGAFLIWYFRSIWQMRMLKIYLPDSLLGFGEHCNWSF